MFRTVFQDLPECRKSIIRCLTGGNLMALRKAIGFWLSENEKKAHLSLLWDVFEDMDWTDDVNGITMIGRGLDYHRAEGQLRAASLTHYPELVPFVVMIRAPVTYDKLVPWIKQILSNIMRSTKMRVVEGDKRKNRWDSKFIATIEGFVAGVKISTPVTVLTQETREDQLGIATMDRTIAISVFEPTLEDVKRITIVKVERNKVQQETAAVITYKTIDTLRFIISGPPFMTNVSLILKPSLEGPECGWPRKSQVFMRVVDNYDRYSSNNREWAALKIQNGLKGW